MHGFYNIQPWNPAGNRLLVHRLPFIDRMPTGADPAELGLIDPARRGFEPLAETRAWNFQIGAMPHWVGGGDGVERILYNDKQEGRFVSVLLDPATGQRRVLPCGIFTVSHDGRFAYGYDFARLQPLRPGYAYAGVPYPVAERPAPGDEGVVRIDLESGTSRLLLSFADLADAFPHPERRGGPVFISRLLCNPGDRRVVFSFRFKGTADGCYYTALGTIDPDGANLHKLADFRDQPAHFDWCGDEHLVVWLHPEGRDRGGFHVMGERDGSRQPLGHDVLERDGHCCFGTDTRRMLLDSFPDGDNMQDLLVYDRERGCLDRLGRFLMPREFSWGNRGGDLRCDLHPCWSRDGRQVCFDSLHEGRRGVYVVDA